MFKCWLTWLLFFGMVFFVHAQDKNSSSLITSCKNLDSALVGAKYEHLQSLLHSKLSLGHSNGLIETKTELLEHLKNGYLKYFKIESFDTPLVTNYKKLATVRRDIKVTGELKQTAFEVKLRVLETWIWQKSAWRLLNRQSTKIN